MSERWKSVDGWPAYAVSDGGRVSSLNRVVYGKRGPMRFRGRVLRAEPGANGYRTVTLTMPGRRRCFNVHALVAHAFLGACPPGREVCHNNGVRSDCRATNLRYDTRQSNALDRHAHGTMPVEGCKGEANGLAKLTDDAVRGIRAQPKATLRALAAVYNVSISAVSLVRCGKTWSHVT